MGHQFLPSSLRILLMHRFMIFWRSPTSSFIASFFLSMRMCSFARRRSSTWSAKRSQAARSPKGSDFGPPLWPMPGLFILPLSFVRRSYREQTLPDNCPLSVHVYALFCIIGVVPYLAFFGLNHCKYPYFVGSKGWCRICLICRWHSPAKGVGPEGSRGFESLRLRHPTPCFY